MRHHIAPLLGRATRPSSQSMLRPPADSVPPHLKRERGSQWSLRCPPWRRHPWRRRSTWSQALGTCESARWTSCRSSNVTTLYKLNALKPVNNGTAKYLIGRFHGVVSRIFAL